MLLLVFIVNTVTSFHDDVESYKIINEIPDAVTTFPGEIYLYNEEWKVIHTTDLNYIYNQGQNLKTQLQKMKNICERSNTKCNLQNLIETVSKELNSIVDVPIQKNREKRDSRPGLAWSGLVQTGPGHGPGLGLLEL